MRSRIAVTLENPNTAARDLASLTKRLMEIVEQIEAIELREKEEAKEGGVEPDEEFDADAI